MSEHTATSIFKDGIDVILFTTWSIVACAFGLFCIGATHDFLVPWWKECFPKKNVTKHDIPDTASPVELKCKKKSSTPSERRYKRKLTKRLQQLKKSMKGLHKRRRQVKTYSMKKKNRDRHIVGIPVWDE